MKGERLIATGFIAPQACVSRGLYGHGFASRAGFAYDREPTRPKAQPCPLLNLSVAIGDYDRNRPLIDGAVKIDGVDPVFMKLVPEEIFFRAFRTQDFDICELSLSSFT